MKNLNIILNETSIINFPFVWSLIKRYKWVTLIVPIIVFSIAVWKYQSQFDIYSTTLGYKYIPDSSGNAPSAAMASILGSDKANTEMTGAEVMAVVRSLDFRQRLAESIYQHPDFKEMSFDNFRTKNPKTWDQTFGHCGDKKECYLNTIAAHLRTLYNSTQDANLPNRFYLKITSLNPKTTRAIRDLIPENMEEERAETIRYNLKKQIKLTQDLKDSKIQELRENKVFSKRDRLQEIEAKLTDVSGTLYEHERLLMQNRNLFTRAKTRVDQTTESLKRGISSEEVRKSERAKKLRESIGSLRSDLSSLMSATGSVSSEDKAIIEGIKKEIKQKQRELSKIDLKKVGLSGIDKFYKDREEDAQFDEFNLNVLRGQYKISQKEVKKLSRLKEKLLVERSELTNSIEKFQPSLKYLKMIETKLIQLKLSASTVVTDIVFDRNDSGILRKKLISKTKLTLAAFFSSFFAVFLIIFIRYMIDDRIYNVTELEKNFSDLEVIGNTPDFD